MDKRERDRRMTRLTPEQFGDYRRLMREVTDEAKSLGGDQIAARKTLFAARSVGIDPDVAFAMDGVAQRDQSGPDVGETAPDFELKRLGTVETVRISEFRGKRPVAMIFGSYT